MSHILRHSLLDAPESLLEATRLRLGTASHGNQGSLLSATNQPDRYER